MHPAGKHLTIAIDRRFIDRDNQNRVVEKFEAYRHRTNSFASSAPTSSQKFYGDDDVRSDIVEGERGELVMIADRKVEEKN